VIRHSSDNHAVSVYPFCQTARLPERSATVPKGFTLQGYIESGEFGYPQGGMIKLKVLFDKGAAPYLYETKTAPRQKLTEQADGKVLLEVNVRDDV